MDLELENVIPLTMLSEYQNPIGMNKTVINLSRNEALTLVGVGGPQSSRNKNKAHSIIHVKSGSIAVLQNLPDEPKSSSNLSSKFQLGRTMIASSKRWIEVAQYPEGSFITHYRFSTEPVRYICSSDKASLICFNTQIQQEVILNSLVTRYFKSHYTIAPYSATHNTNASIQGMSPSLVSLGSELIHLTNDHLYFCVAGAVSVYVCSSTFPLECQDPLLVATVDPSLPFNSINHFMKLYKNLDDQRSLYFKATSKLSLLLSFPTPYSSPDATKKRRKSTLGQKMVRSILNLKMNRDDNYLDFYLRQMKRNHPFSSLATQSTNIASPLQSSPVPGYQFNLRRIKTFSQVSEEIIDILASHSSCLNCVPKSSIEIQPGHLYCLTYGRFIIREKYSSRIIHTVQTRDTFFMLNPKLLSGKQDNLDQELRMDPKWFSFETDETSPCQLFVLSPSGIEEFKSLIPSKAEVVSLAVVSLLGRILKEVENTPSFAIIRHAIRDLFKIDSSSGIFKELLPHMSLQHVPFDQKVLTEQLSLNGQERQQKDVMFIVATGIVCLFNITRNKIFRSFPPMDYFGYYNQRGRRGSIDEATVFVSKHLSGSMLIRIEEPGIRILASTHPMHIARLSQLQRCGADQLADLAQMAKFPKVIMTKIFRQLALKDQLQCRLVCSRWNRFLRWDMKVEMLKMTSSARFSFSTYRLVFMATCSGNNLRMLTLKNTNAINRTHIDILTNYCRGIQEFVFHEELRRDIRSFELIMSRLTDLRVLDLLEIPPLKSVNMAAIQCPNLHRLKVAKQIDPGQVCTRSEGNVLDEFLDRLPNLREFEVVLRQSQFQLNIFKSVSFFANQLDTLSLQGSGSKSYVNDAAISFIATMRNLKHLDISMNAQLTDMALYNLSKSIQLFETLNLSGLPFITDSGICYLESRLRNLKRIKMKWCNCISAVSVSLILQSSEISIESIDLSGTSIKSGDLTMFGIPTEKVIGIVDENKPVNKIPCKYIDIHDRYHANWIPFEGKSDDEDRDVSSADESVLIDLLPIYEETPTLQG